MKRADAYRFRKYVENLRTWISMIIAHVGTNNVCLLVPMGIVAKGNM